MIQVLSWQFQTLYNVIFTLFNYHINYKKKFRIGLIDHTICMEKKIVWEWDYVHKITVGLGFVATLLPIYTFCMNGPYPGDVASRLATIVYIAMVMPILYDNSYSPNDTNLK